jgi:hypothetical protein
VRENVSLKVSFSLVFSSWLLALFFSSLFLNPTLTPDSSEFMQTTSFGSALLTKSPIYAVVIRLLGFNLDMIVFFQCVLLLFSSLLLWRLLLGFLSRTLVTVLTIAFILNPLAWFFCFQVLTEMLSLTVVVLFVYLCLTRIKQSSGSFSSPKINNLSLLFLFSFTLFLRPNLTLLFVITLVARCILTWMNKLTFSFSAPKICFVITTSIAIAQLLLIFASFSLTKRSFEGPLKPLNVGIAMHMATAIPSIQDSAFAESYMDFEFTIRKENPTNQPWAVQKAIGVEFQGRNQELKEQVAFGISKELLFKYPLLYVQSVISTIITLPLSDMFAHAPSNTIPYSIIKIFQLLFIFINLLLFLSICYNVTLLKLNPIYLENKYVILQLSFLIGLVSFIVTNSLVSPIEQLRYLFPAFPIFYFLVTQTLYMQNLATKFGRK